MKSNEFVLELLKGGSLEDILKTFVKNKSLYNGSVLGVDPKKVTFSSGENGEVIAEVFEWYTTYSQTHTAIETYTLTDFTCFVSTEFDNGNENKETTKELNQEWVDELKAKLPEEKREAYQKAYLKNVDSLTTKAIKDVTANSQKQKAPKRK